MIIFEHFRCPLHRYTFSVASMKSWVEGACEGHVLNLFAGPTLLNLKETRNDLDPSMKAHYNLDARDFLAQWEGERFDTILLDPPYSARKSMELYNGKLCSPFYQLKTQINRVLKPGGLVITFGYHSIVMGAGRQFVVERIALFSHGGAIHDTIASIERYRPSL